MRNIEVDPARNQGWARQGVGKFAGIYNIAAEIGGFQQPPGYMGMSDFIGALSHRSMYTPRGQAKLLAQAKKERPEMYERITGKKAAPKKRRQKRARQAKKKKTTSRTMPRGRTSTAARAARAATTDLQGRVVVPTERTVAAKWVDESAMANTKLGVMMFPGSAASPGDRITEYIRALSLVALQSGNGGRETSNVRVRTLSINYSLECSGVAFSQTATSLVVCAYVVYDRFPGNSVPAISDILTTDNEEAAQFGSYGPGSMINPYNATRYRVLAASHHDIDFKLDNWIDNAVTDYGAASFPPQRGSFTLEDLDMQYNDTTGNGLGDLKNGAIYLIFTLRSRNSQVVGTAMAGGPITSSNEESPNISSVFYAVGGVGNGIHVMIPWTSRTFYTDR